MACKKYWIGMFSGCSIGVYTDEHDAYLCGEMKKRVLNELTTIDIIYEEEIAKGALSAVDVVTFPTNQEISE
ncbi:unnamed protein product [Rotaria sp. Silwood2]|nr:unnamed protein product [Rotaria sp. Silwood2]CAF2793992.1 unnamed protein product [Rotaria sp. Silwood2]CAF3997761.1 unnamed protein product [Rotaria sp. Silwood2]CAF4008803.1 unnamed protein product [Rotaria sp. Silwood2]CAF4013480.1 unnamed protein product [Rotaria sp. Silwood2]